MIAAAADGCKRLLDGVMCSTRYAVTGCSSATMPRASPPIQRLRSLPAFPSRMPLMPRRVLYLKASRSFLSFAATPALRSATSVIVYSTELPSTMAISEGVRL
jgi:hypothetical protein